MQIGICYIWRMKRIKDLEHLRQELRHWFVQKGMRTSVSIAKYAGINQSQIHRNLFGSPQRLNPTLRQLCKITSIDPYDNCPDPRTSAPLMEALGAVWDGSEQHARHLAAVIYAVKRAAVRP